MFVFLFVAGFGLMFIRVCCTFLYLPSLSYQLKFNILPVFCFFALQNCHSRIQELFSDKIYLIGIAALVVAVIMVRTKTLKPSL